MNRAPLTRALSLLLVLQMTPSVWEAVENVVHLVVEGHAAHEIADSDHRPEGTEHGCSGPYHVCFCHQTTSFLPSVAVPFMATADDPLRAEFRPATEVFSAGFRDRLFRPPQLV